MNERGQITVFIIIGILILGIVGAFIYLKDKAAKKGIEETEGVLDVEPIKMFIEHCLEKNTEEGLLLLGLQGGYYNPPEPNKKFDETTIPYYFYLGKENFPTLETTEKELGAYIKEKMSECLNLTSFENEGYSFVSDNLSAEVSFGEGIVTSNLIYPLTIKKENKEFNLKYFSKKTPLDFKKFYGIVEEIVTEQREAPEGIPISFLAEKQEKGVFWFDTINWGDEVLFNLFFEEESSEEGLYQFSFMVKYNWSENSSENLAEQNEEEKESEFIQIAKPTKYYLEQNLNFLAEGEDGGVSNGESGSLMDWDNPAAISRLNPEQLLTALNNDPSLLSRLTVLANFESRLEDPIFISELNGKRNVLNRWAEGKGLSFGNEGKLKSYFTDGRIITEGTAATDFKIGTVPEGTEVLKEGNLKFPDGTIVGNAVISEEKGMMAIAGGVVDLSSSQREEKIRIKTTGSLIRFRGYEASSTKPILFSTSSIPTLEGKGISIKEEGKIKYEFTGQVTFDEVPGGSNFLRLKKGTTLKDYDSQEEVNSKYTVNQETAYFTNQGSCTKEFKNCIEKDFQKSWLKVRARGKEIDYKSTTKYGPLAKKGASGKEAEIVVEQLGKTNGIFLDSVDKKDKINENGMIVSTGKITFKQGKGEIIASGGKIKLKGEPLDIKEEIATNFFSSEKQDVFNLNFKPAEHGLKMEQCNKDECSYTGTLTKETLAVLEKMRRVDWARESQEAKKLKEKYGGETPRRYRNYLNDLTELRLVEAFIKASQTSGVSVNYLIASAGVEGLFIESWMNRYYENPGTSVDSYGDLGLDRLAKEIPELKRKGYLRDDFGQKEEYQPKGEVENERGETVEILKLTNVDYALEAFGAMMAYRRDFFLADVKAAGYNPKRLSGDQIAYWTYLYYNSGSGKTHGDDLGLGTDEVKTRLKQSGFAGLNIPTTSGGGLTVKRNVIRNPQIVLGTKKILDWANPGLPKIAKEIVLAGKEEEKQVVVAKVEPPTEGE